MTTNESVCFLCDILSGIKSKSVKNFSGIGLILYEHIDNIPISPLREKYEKLENLPVRGIDNIISALIRYSDIDNIFHDGFHLISQDGELTHLSQHFFPPKIRSVNMNSDTYGTRYASAKYGAYIPGIIACGIISNSYGYHVFSNR